MPSDQRDRATAALLKTLELSPDLTDDDAEAILIFVRGETLPRWRH